MKKKISINALCFVLAGIIAVGYPCYTAIAGAVSTTKRSNSGIKSTGNVEYIDANGTRTVNFAIEDLYYLENRIEDELVPICK